MHIDAPTSYEFVDTVMEGLKNDNLEIGSGTTVDIPER